MIKRIKFLNKYNEPCDFVVEIIEEDKKWIYAKLLEDNKPILIQKKRIIEILSPRKEKIG